MFTTEYLENKSEKLHLPNLKGHDSALKYEIKNNSVEVKVGNLREINIRFKKQTNKMWFLFFSRVFFLKRRGWVYCSNIKVGSNSVLLSPGSNDKNDTT